MILDGTAGISLEDIENDFNKFAVFRLSTVIMSFATVLLQNFAVYGCLVMDGANIGKVIAYQYSGFMWFKFNIYSFNFVEGVSMLYQTIAAYLALL